MIFIFMTPTVLTILSIQSGIYNCGVTVPVSPPLRTSYRFHRFHCLFFAKRLILYRRFNETTPNLQKLSRRRVCVSVVFSLCSSSMASQVLWQRRRGASSTRLRMFFCRRRLFAITPRVCRSLLFWYVAAFRGFWGCGRFSSA